jgi:hypothetical protein
VSCKGNDSAAAKNELEIVCALQISKDTDSRGPMFRAIAVKKGGQATNSIGDIWPHSNSNVV